VVSCGVEEWSWRCGEETGRREGKDFNDGSKKLRHVANKTVIANGRSTLRTSYFLSLVAAQEDCSGL